MTGSRNERNYKVGLAVALAAVMVVSMLGMGFVGSAGAVTGEFDGDSPPTEAEALVSSNPAGSEDTEVDHVVTIEIGDDDAVVGDAFGTDDDDSQIVIDYDNAGAINGASLETIEYVDKRTEEITNLEGASSDDDGEITVNELDKFDDADENTLSSGDLVRVHLSDIDNDAFTAGDVSISVESDSQSTEVQSQSIDVPLDDQAGIKIVDDPSDNEKEYYTSFEQAAEETGDEITFLEAGFTDEYDEVLTQPTSINDGLEKATIDENNVEVSVEDNADQPEVISSAPQLISIEEGATDVEIDGIEFTGTSTLSDIGEENPSETAIENIGQGDNSERIEDNDFNDFTGAVIDVNDPLVDDLEIAENEFAAQETDGEYQVVVVDDIATDAELELQDNEANDLVTGDQSVVEVTLDDEGDGGDYSQADNNIVIQGDQYTFTGDSSNSATVLDVEADDDSGAKGVDIVVDGASVDVGDSDADVDGIALENAEGQATDDDLFDLTVETEDATEDDDGVFDGLRTAVDLTGLDDGDLNTPNNDVVIDDVEILNTDTAVDISEVAADGNDELSIDLTLEDVEVAGGTDGVEFTPAENNVHEFDLTLDDESDSASEFTDLEGTAIELDAEVADGDIGINTGDDDAEFSGTTFGDTGEAVESGIVIGDGVEPDDVKIADDVSFVVDGGTAIDFQPEDDSDLTVNDVSITGDTDADDVGILVNSGTGSTLTLDYETAEIDGVYSGVEAQDVDVLDDGEEADISSLTFDDISGDSDDARALDIQAHDGDETYEVNDFEVLGDSGDATAIRVDDADVNLDLGPEDPVSLGASDTDDGVETGILMNSGDGDVTVTNLDVGLSESDGDGIRFESSGELTLADDDLTIAGDAPDDQTAIHVEEGSAEFTIEDDVDEGLTIEGVENGIDIQNLDTHGFTGTGTFDRQLNGVTFTEMGDGTAITVEEAELLDVGAQNALVVLDVDVDSADSSAVTGVDFSSDDALAVINSEFTDAETGVDVGSSGELDEVGAAVVAGVEITLEDDSDGSGLEVSDDTALVEDGLNLETDDDRPLTVESVEVDEVNDGTLSIVGAGSTDSVGIDVKGESFNFGDQTATTTIEAVETGVVIDGGDIVGDLTGLVLEDIGTDGSDVGETGAGVHVDDISSGLTINHLEVRAADGASPVGVLFEDDGTESLTLSEDEGEPILLGEDQETAVGAGVLAIEDGGDDLGSLTIDSDAEVDVTLEETEFNDVSGQDPNVGLAYLAPSTGDDVTFESDLESVEIDGLGDSETDHASGGILIEGDDSTSTDITLDGATDSITIQGVENGLAIDDAATLNGDDGASFDGLELTDIGDGDAIRFGSDLPDSFVDDDIELTDLEALEFTEDSEADDAVALRLEGDISTGDSYVIEQVDVEGPSADSDAVGVLADTDAVVEFDNDLGSSDEASTVEDVGTGLQVDAAHDVEDFDGEETTTFDNIGDTAIELSDPLDTDLTVDNVDVTDSDDATAIVYDIGDGTSLTVQNSDFDAVDSGIQSANPGTDANELTVNNVLVDGTDASGIGIEADIDGEFNADNDVEIDSVAEGIVLSETGSTAEIGTLSVEAADVGLDVDDAGDALTVDGASIDSIEGEDETTAIAFDDGSNDLTVTDADIGTSWAVETGVDVQDVNNDVTVDANSDDGTKIHLSNSGDAVGVDATDVSSNIDDDLTVEDVTVIGDGDGTAVHVGDTSANVEFDVDDGASVITDVEDGLVIADANEINDEADTDGELSDTDFTGLTGTAIDFADVDGHDLTLQDIEVSEASETTVVEFDDSDANIEVADTDLDGAVHSYVVVEDAYDEVTVDGVDQEGEDDAQLLLDGGVGVEVNDVGLSGDLTIENIDEIIGENGEATAIDADLNSESNELDVTGLDRIEDVGTALDLTDLSTQSDSTIDLGDVLDEAEIDGYSDAALHIESDVDDVQVGDADLTGAGDDAVAVRIDDTDDDADVTIRHTAIDADGEDAIAIELESVSDSSSDHEIHFNDITGFDYGLAGDAVEDLEREDAVANYWGDGGPLSEDASTVDVTLTDTDSEDAADRAAIYDPYLTADTDTVADNNDVDASELERGVGIQEVGQDLQVQSSGQTIAFPAQTDGSLADAFVDVEPEADVEEDGVKVWEYNAETDEYELVDADEEQPNFDAYVSTLEDEDSVQAINVDYDNSQGTPGAYSYEEGFNLVPITQATDDDLDDVTRAATFGLDSEDDVTITGSPTPALGSIYAHDSDFGNYDADEVGDLEVDLAPYHGVWIAIEDEDEDAGAADSVYTGPTDGTITLEQILDGSLEDEAS